ncbi:transcriptional regulator [Mameliella alba]|nr:transcriptional regulator [Mameliella alba]
MPSGLPMAEEIEPMMLKYLAQVAGFAPAQAHAYLVSYRKIGLIEQDEEMGHYRRGRFALDLGVTSIRTIDPISLATDAVTELADRTALHVALVVWGSFGPTVVTESGSQLNMNTRPGKVYSMSGTASGRVFSAFLPEATVEATINLEKREKTDSGRVGVHRFMSRKELDHIREVGYATVVVPPVPGISAYAAPVFDHAGQMVMAITIFGQDHYLKGRAEEGFIPALIEAAGDLSSELEYVPAH